MLACVGSQGHFCSSDCMMCVVLVGVFDCFCSVEIISVQLL